MRQCDGTCFEVGTGSERKCRSKPVTERQCWRLGEKCEPAIVESSISLCRSCAQRFDEAQSEAELEVIAS